MHAGNLRTTTAEPFGGGDGRQNLGGYRAKHHLNQQIQHGLCHDCSQA
jgi:hypothetical protein